MNPYKHQQDALTLMGSLLTKIINLDGEIKTANEYNRNCVIHGMEFDVDKLRNKRENMKFEYNELILKLKLK